MYNKLKTSLDRIWLSTVRSQLTRLIFYTIFICLLIDQTNAQIMYHSLPQAPQLANNNPLIQPVQQAQATLRPSLYPPLLKVKTQEGYLFENAEIGVSYTDCLKILKFDEFEYCRKVILFLKS